MNRPLLDRFNALGVAVCAPLAGMAVFIIVLLAVAVVCTLIG